MFGHLPVVKQLVAAGSDITWKNRDGFTPSEVARQQNYTSVVDYLQERWALMHSKNKNGTSVKRNSNRK